MTHYQTINIKIKLKYGIEKKQIPNEFKDQICKAVKKEFPNWSYIEYIFKN